MAQYRCMWLYWQEVLLVGITAPMYAVHAHARSWRLLDSLALLLSIAGALQSHHHVQVLCTSLFDSLVHEDTKHLPAHQLASLASACTAKENRVCLVRVLAAASYLLFVQLARCKTCHSTLLIESVADGRLASCNGGGLPAP